MRDDLIFIICKQETISVYSIQQWIETYSIILPEEANILNIPYGYKNTLQVRLINILDLFYLILFF